MPARPARSAPRLASPRRNRGERERPRDVGDGEGDRSVARGEDLGTEDSDEGDGHDDVDHGDEGERDDDGAGDVALRVANLFTKGCDAGIAGEGEEKKTGRLEDAEDAGARSEVECDAVGGGRRGSRRSLRRCRSM